MFLLFVFMVPTTTIKVFPKHIFAHSAASILVEGHNINHLPTIDKINQRLNEYRELISPGNFSIILFYPLMRIPES